MVSLLGATCYVALRGVLPLYRVSNLLLLTYYHFLLWLLSFMMVFLPRCRPRDLQTELVREETRPFHEHCRLLFHGRILEVQTEQRLGTMSRYILTFGSGL